MAVREVIMPVCCCGAWASPGDWGLLQDAWDLPESWCPIHGCNRRQIREKVLRWRRERKITEEQFDRYQQEYFKGDKR